MARERTTIAVYPDTRDDLRELKRGGESYDEVLQRLIKTDGPEASA